VWQLVPTLPLFPIFRVSWSILKKETQQIELALLVATPSQAHKSNIPRDR